jgi:hypothetical protein
VISISTFNTSAVDDINMHRILIIDSNFTINNSFLRYRPFDEGGHHIKEVHFFLFNELSLGTDSKDNIFVAEKHENKIMKYTTEGKLLKTFDRDLPFEIKTYVGN